MKTTLRYLFLIVLSASLGVTAQNFGTFASAVWLTNCEQSNFYNTTGEGASLIGPVSNVFTNTNFGVFRQNSGQFIFRGGELKTFKTPSGNVCSVRINYRIYLTTATPGSFSTIDFPFFNDCNTAINEFPSGGPCSAGDQKWQRVIPNGATTPFAPVDLTNRPPGDYVLEVYYDVTGSNNSSSACNETIFLNNNGQNYRAFFSIRPTPAFTFTNPTTCGGADGTITLSGLQPSTTYSFNFNNNGTPSGTLFITPTALGTHTIQNLTQGTYSNFNLLINGCTTTINTPVTLTDPSVEAPLSGGNQTVCESNPVPLLTATATAPSGAVVVWFDAPTGGNVIDNPGWNEVGTITYYAESQDNTLNCVSPNRTAVTLTIEPAPEAPTGVSPQLFCTDATVVLTLQDLQVSGQSIQWYASETEAIPLPADTPIQTGSYFATQTVGNCESLTRLEIQVVTETLINPVFTFGNTIDVCEGDIFVVALPNISENNIVGSWNPAAVNTTESGTYIFTPETGACANTFELTVTIFPTLTPEFEFGNAINLCIGDTSPELPSISQNGITGTWNPATIDNTQSNTYTFVPEIGLCAAPITLLVDIFPALIPEFDFGNELNACFGDVAPALALISQNGITGTWSPEFIDTTQNGNYVFTPNIGFCAESFLLQVNIFQLLTPEFEFDNFLELCSGDQTPELPAISQNGITGTWSPSAINNTQSGSYTFTPEVGLCATPFSLQVDIFPGLTPVFEFGTTLNLCSGDSAPQLPNVAQNGITGTWSPSAINNTQSGSYTFTPEIGFCAEPFVLNVTVSAPINFVIEWTCENENYILSTPNAPNNISIEWTNSNGMTVGNNSTTFNVTQHLAGQSDNTTLPLTFFATVTDINGCSVTQSFTIEAVYCGIQRGISPNGDNLNDFFDLQLLNVKHLSIFNRYGVKVYEKENYTREWVGQTSGGKELPTATYYYVIEFRNGESVTGWIYVQRENGS